MRWALLLFLWPMVMGFEWDGRVNRLRQQYDTGDVRARRGAIRQLASVGAAAASPLVLRALEDPESIVRQDAAQMAARLRIEAAAPLLVEWLEDPEAAIRVRAARALGHLGGPRAVPLLVRSLGDIDAEVRMAAVDALGALRLPATVVPLLGRLDDEDERVRSRAAATLGQSGDARAVIPLIGRARDTPEVRQAAFTALGRLGDERAVSALIGALGDENESARIAAIQAIGLLAPSRALGALQETIDGANRQVASAAIMAIAQLPGDEATEALLHLPVTYRGLVAELLPRRPGDALAARVVAAMERQHGERVSHEAILLATLRAHPDPTLAPRIRRLAATPGFRHPLLALALSGDPEVLPHLLASLPTEIADSLDALESYFDQHPADPRATDPLLAALHPLRGPFRRRVVRLLGQTGAPRAVPALTGLLEGASSTERLELVRAIGQIGGAESADALLPHLDDDRADVRFTAAQALSPVVGPNHIDHLVAQLGAPPPVDRYAYFEALRDTLAQDRLAAVAKARVVELIGQYLRSGDLALGGLLVSLLAEWAAPEADALLRDVEESLGPAAITAQAHRGSQEAVEAALEGNDRRIRLAALAAAGETRLSATPTLLRHLLGAVEEGSWPAPAAASFALARLAGRGELDDAVTAPLCEGLRHRDPHVRANLLVALGHLDGRCEGVDFMAWLGSTQSLMVQRAVVRYARLRGEMPSACEATDAPATCQVSDEAGSPMALYVYDGPTLRRNALVSVRLADGTVFVGYTDPRGVVDLTRVPPGEIRVGDPTEAPLEP